MITSHLKMHLLCALYSLNVCNLSPFTPTVLGLIVEAF